MVDVLGSLASISRTPTEAPGAVIIVGDARLDRLAVIRRAAGQVDLLVVPVEHLANASSAPAVPIALIALGREPVARAAADSVARTCLQRGYTLVGYEDGVNQWPLAVRSRLLLSGMSRLLDSALPGFEAELVARLADVVGTATRRRRSHHELREQMNACGIVGESPAMLAVFGWVTRISQFSDLAVLFRGETGTGKDLLARAVHRLDPSRRHGPLVAVNCAALPRQLAESELFGHRRGAFTGAESTRRGLVRAADGGILFLDEIGELDLEVQGKLLRVLQEGRVMALGDEHEVPVNVRVVAATHRNLEEMVTRGTFREDLLHRLQILSVEVPPLRDRPDDLRPLVALFVEKYQSLSPVKRVAVGSDFLDALAQLDLPGNVRQLENVVRRAVTCKEDEAPLGLSDLSADLWRRLEARAAPTEMAASEDASAAGCVSAILESDSSAERLLAAHDWDLSRALAHLERRLVDVAVRRSKGNQSEAARLLGITPRSVYNKLRKHPDEPRRR